MILSKHAFRRSLFEPFKMFYSPGGLQNVLCLEGRGKAYPVEVQWSSGFYLCNIRVRKRYMTLSKHKSRRGLFEPFKIFYPPRLREMQSISSRGSIHCDGPTE